MDTILFSDLASRVVWDQYALEYGYSVPARTEAGPRCGRCKDGSRHANAASVRACYEVSAAAMAEAAAERYAEGGFVRYLENQGSCSGIVNYTDPQGGPCLCC